MTEFHKEGLPKDLIGVEADLESFEGYWKKKGGSVKVKGEYHKEGAPFLDRDPGWDIKMEESANTAENEPSGQEGPEERPKEQVPAEPVSDSPEGPAPKGSIQRPIDLSMIEMASYALFRVAFSKGVSIPIKREGMVDMDVTVKGKEITINTNQLYFTVPELNVWHIVYQHKGRPVLELGRGVKNGMMIHRMGAIRLGLEMWNGSRKMNKMKLKQLKEAEKKAHEGSKDE
ncbi:MAG: hypothetical protein ABR986_03320 [Methanomassiliicoccales archaeon]